MLALSWATCGAWLISSLRIDYIFCNEHFGALDPRVTRDRDSSEHRLVVSVSSLLGE
jgi:hypothetical protein